MELPDAEIIRARLAARRATHRCPCVLCGLPAPYRAIIDGELARTGRDYGLVSLANDLVDAGLPIATRWRLRNHVLTCIERRCALYRSDDEPPAAA